MSTFSILQLLNLGKYLLLPVMEKKLLVVLIIFLAAELADELRCAWVCRKLCDENYHLLPLGKAFINENSLFDGVLEDADE